MNQRIPPDRPVPPGTAERKDRLSAALRANLKRRKVQDRARSAEAAPKGDAEKGTDQPKE